VPYNANATLQQGLITEDDIDTVLKRLFRVRLRLGQFDPPGPLSTIGVDQVCTPDHLELARDGVRQSVVLVKNTGGLLPLSAANYKAPVVIGPLATLGGEGTTGYYGSTPCNGTASYSAQTAIQQFIAGTTAVLGVPSVGSNDTSGIPAAATAAAAADLVVLAIGSDLNLEAEGNDR
jgi:beta-glucosidase-like glycosyl hydrolase